MNESHGALKKAMLLRDAYMECSDGIEFTRHCREVFDMDDSMAELFWEVIDVARDLGATPERAETTKWKTRQEADKALKAAKDSMLDAERALDDADAEASFARAELDRAQRDCNKAEEAFGRIKTEWQKVSEIADT